MRCRREAYVSWQLHCIDSPNPACVITSTSVPSLVSSSLPLSLSNSHMPVGGKISESSSESYSRGGRSSALRWYWPSSWLAVQYDVKLVYDWSDGTKRSMVTPPHLEGTVEHSRMSPCTRSPNLGLVAPVRSNVRSTLPTGVPRSRARVIRRLAGVNPSIAQGWESPLGVSTHTVGLS